MLSKNYTPIDYSSWNFDGQGKNISELLTEYEKTIWNKSLPFQDKREDVGHAEIATFFALELTQRLNLDHLITIPATILHDIGYKISPQEFRKIFITEPDKQKQLLLRSEHQIIGVNLAHKIISELHTTLYNPEVLSIIADHDTRFCETTSNGQAMRDADILWRFTLPHHNAYLSHLSKEEILSRSKDDFSLLHYDLSREIANTELQNSLKYFKQSK